MVVPTRDFGAAPRQIFYHVQGESTPYMLFCKHHSGCLTILLNLFDIIQPDVCHYLATSPVHQETFLEDINNILNTGEAFPHCQQIMGLVGRTFATKVPVDETTASRPSRLKP